MSAPRTKSIVVSLATGMLALLAIGAYFYFAPRSAPGQPSLVHLDAGNIDALRSEFNAAGGTRVVLLLSPT